MFGKCCEVVSGFSDYVIYFDESGSPELTADSGDFPVFVLACVCVEKCAYTDQIVPKLQALKFKYFGHDQAIFHERDIRRSSGEFAFLRSDASLRQAFLEDVTALIDGFDFSISATVVDKLKLRQRYPDPYSPYEISLLLTMEHLALTLRDQKQIGKIVHVIAESRGAKEDKDLELVFRRIAAGDTPMGSNQAGLIIQFNWQLLFCDKKSNSSGLQIADLIARPIGLKHLRPDQPNRAFDVIERKMAWWTKTFP